MYAPHNTKTIDATHETIVAKFGSRLSMNFRPQTRQIFLSPIGRFFDKPIEINFGLYIDGIEYGLGFGYRQRDFQYIEQHEYVDRVVYRCRDFNIGVDCTVEFISPFYPKDERLSLIPAIFVKATVERIIDRKVRDDDERNIEVFCDVRMTDFQEKDGLLLLDDTYYLTDDHIYYQDTDNLRNFLNKHSYHKTGKKGQIAIASVSEGYRIDGKTIFVPTKISSKEQAQSIFVIAGYSSDNILKIKNDEYKFKYTMEYKSIYEVIEYAKSHAIGIIQKSRRFNDSIQNSSLSSNVKELIGFSMRSFFANSFWCISKEGTEWFSISEGNCLFHSTVDVEYNEGLFYYLFWPELMEINFDNWTNFKDKNSIAHDLGAILNIGEQGYPHSMKIEESSNFLLMLYAYYKMYNKKELVEKYQNLIVELTEFLKSCDLTGNGLPNKETENTIDDSSDDVQFAEEQIYLGIKEYCAYVASYEMLTALSANRAAELCKQEAIKIKNTIENTAWREDHYAVNLISTKRKINAFSIYESEGGDVFKEGKDAYSIYTTNGLLYLFMVGQDCFLDKEKLKQDIIKSHNKCKTQYGDTHSSIDKSNIWISQNIWRDLCACYFGIDMIDNADDYWKCEVFENQGGRGGCFIDTYGWNKLNYYPRGIVSIGYVFSSIGLAIDGINKTISFSPCRVPCKMPIYQFAKWDEEIIPMVEFFVEDGVINYRVDNVELLKDYTIINRNRKQEWNMCKG